MTNIERNQRYTQKQHNLLLRRELIKRLRRNAGLSQLFAFLFVAGGLALDIWMKIEKISNIMLTAIAIVVLVIGVILQVIAVIYFSKAKKHLSGQTIIASTNPKNWV